MNLADINDKWNRAIRPIVEPEGKDRWQTPIETIKLRTGDCEDYAIGKYFTLEAFGAPHHKTLATVKLVSGEHHCMLIVNDWVLDNKSKEIVKIEDRVDIANLLYLSSRDKPEDPRFAALLTRINTPATHEAIGKFFFGA